VEEQSPTTRDAAPVTEFRRGDLAKATWSSPLVIQVGLLCLPTLLGVGVFTVLGLILRHTSTPIDLAPLNTIALLGVFACFFGAAYGPVLIPVAVTITLVGHRQRSLGTSASWVIIVLSVGAAVLGHMWALDAVELP
jgi:hypothetical protein